MAEEHSHVAVARELWTAVAEGDSERLSDVLAPGVVWPERFPRSATYDPAWIGPHQMGPDPLWLTEWLCERTGLPPGSSVLVTVVYASGLRTDDG